MHALLKLLPGFSRRNGIARQLHSQAVAQARLPAFYSGLEVPDTVDGRYELICLHVYLILHKLKEAGQAGAALSQDLFDYTFKDMDCAIREMGVGDLSVARHMKRMMEGFHGRCSGYEAALSGGRKDSDSHSLLQQALKRNLYATVKIGPTENTVAAITDYIYDSLELLSAAVLLQGNASFASPPKAQD